MATKLVTIVAFFLTGIAFAQSADKWPALRDLHTVMSATFHPAAEGNFAPIKSRSEELMLKASALLKSDIPADFRTRAILNLAEELQLKTKTLHALVTAKAPDEEITKALSDAYGVFHDIEVMSPGYKR